MTVVKEQKKKSQKSVREVCSCSGAFHSVAVWQPGADAGKEGQSRSIGSQALMRERQDKAGAVGLFIVLVGLFMRERRDQAGAVGLFIVLVGLFIVLE